MLKTGFVLVHFILHQRYIQIHDEKVCEKIAPPVFQPFSTQGAEINGRERKFANLKQVKFNKKIKFS